MLICCADYNERSRIGESGGDIQQSGTNRVPVPIKVRERSIRSAIYDDTTTLKKIFRFRSEEVVYEDFDYDMDNDIKSIVRKEPVDAQIRGTFGFNGFKCILLDVAKHQYNEVKVYLYTFSKEGELIDRLSVGLFFEDHVQDKYFVIDNDIIKTYKYVYNEANWDKAKNKKKNDDAPTMFAHEESYEITPKGAFEFQGKKTYPLKYNSYFKCDHEDDPMVKYIR